MMKNASLIDVCQPVLLSGTLICHKTAHGYPAVEVLWVQVLFALQPINNVANSSVGVLSLPDGVGEQIIRHVRGHATHDAVPFDSRLVSSDTRLSLRNNVQIRHPSHDSGATKLTRIPQPKRVSPTTIGAEKKHAQPSLHCTCDV